MIINLLNIIIIINFVSLIKILDFLTIIIEINQTANEIIILGLNNIL